MDDGSSDWFFSIALPVFAVVFLATVVLMVVSVMRSRRVLRDAGLDALTAQAQLAAGLARGPLMAPVRSLAERLAELDDLHDRGVIDDAEHSAGRASALADG